MLRKKKESRSEFITDEDANRAKHVTETILNSKEVEDSKKEVLLNLISRYKMHMGNAYKAQMSYRRLAHALAIITPTLGAIVTAFSIIQVQSPTLAALGILVTVTSAINSSYQASYGFERCADILIKLNDWFVDFEISLIAHLDTDSNFSINDFSDFARRKNEEMSKIGREYTSVAVPYLSGLSRDSFPHPEFKRK